MDVAELVELSKLRAFVRSGGARAVRLAAGVSLREMARPINVSPTTIYRWETNERTIRAGAKAIAYKALLDALVGKSFPPLKQSPQAQVVHEPALRQVRRRD